MPTRPVVMRTTPVELRLPNDLLAYLTRRAEAEERSLTSLIVLLLREAKRADQAKEV